MVISPQIQLGTLGMDDTLLLMVLALVLLGPKRLPMVGRQIGKLMYEFRKASNDFKFQLEEELRNAEDADRRKREETLIVAQSAVAKAQSAADQALLAAQQAQTAAEAAQSVTHSLPEAAAPNPGIPGAGDLYPGTEPIAAAVAERSTVAPVAPELANSFGCDEATTAESMARSATAPAAEPASAALRVQPPTTGEQVPAARPAGRTTQNSAAVQGEAIQLKKEVDAEEQPAATESTAQHG